MSIIKVCCNCVLLLYPIIQVFFLYFGTVTTEVWLRLSVLWDFFDLLDTLAYCFDCKPSRAYNNVFCGFRPSHAYYNKFQTRYGIRFASPDALA